MGESEPWVSGEGLPRSVSHGSTHCPGCRYKEGNPYKESEALGWGRPGQKETDTGSEFWKKTGTIGHRSARGGLCREEGEGTPV